LYSAGGYLFHLRHGEIQVLIASIPVVMAWAIFAARTSSWRAELPKLLILGSPWLLYPIAISSLLEL